MDNEKILYHYCSLESFFNIIKSSSFWLSDVSKSNDYEEFTWARDKTKAKIEEFLKTEEPQALKAWNAGHALLPEIKDIGANVYTLCLSEKSDLLSQWRGYADDGMGISIGLSSEYFSNNEKHTSYTYAFGKIIYDENEQEHFIDEIVFDNIMKMMDGKGVGHVGLELNQNYILKYALCKNPYFWEEQEWRVMFLSNALPHPVSKKKNRVNQFLFSKTQYRIANKQLVSYVEMDFSEIKKDFIKEIWIGPKSNVLDSDIRDFLLSEGYYDSEYSIKEPIKITKSVGSYR